MVKITAPFEHTPRAFNLVWRTSRAAAIGVIALTVLSALSSVQIAYVGKLIVDSVVLARGTVQTGVLSPTIIQWITLEFALVVAAALIERCAGLLYQALGARLTLQVSNLILTKALTLSLAQFETPLVNDKLRRARSEASARPLSLMLRHLQVLRSCVTVAAYVVLLVRLDSWIFLGLVIACIPAFVAEAKFSEATFHLRNLRSPDRRRLNYLEYVATDDRHCKEVKLFRLGPILLERYASAAEKFHNEEFSLLRRRSIWTYLLSLFSTVGCYVCYGGVAIHAARGAISIGDMTLYFAAIRQGQQGVQTILSAIGGMYEDNLYMSNLFDFLSITTDVPQRLGSLGAPRPQSVSASEKGIRFHHVSFRYPDASDWALQDVNIFVPESQSLALVGENGAGKTTLLKLLIRLYEPTVGQVMLDGRDVRAWEPGALSRRLGVIFQDFNRYQFNVRENVGAGSAEHFGDPVRATRALQSAGAWDFVRTLPRGVDTQLGRWFSEGLELSGGEWQRIALARAFMQEDADILILDEPTAALDAAAEHALFERFEKLTQGRTAIVISHRFPTVRMADRVVVLEKGRVVEEGTHAELLALGSRYAQLFALQAQGYQ